MSAMGIESVNIDVNKKFKVTAKEGSVEIERRASNGLPQLKGLILSSPSNPTGAMLTPEEVKELTGLCEMNGICYIR